MGSFFGHALPGTIFFIFGAWWVTQMFRRYFLCRQTGKRFISSANYPCSFCPAQRMRKWPIEPTLKIALTTVGIIVEFIGGIDSTGHFTSVGNGQHITMYFFFLLSGILDILTLKRIAPYGTDYAGIVVALLVEWSLFKFHLYGRTELDVLLHELLLYVLGLSAVVVALEGAFRRAPILAFGRACLTLIQGTWFWAVGIILYNPFPGAKPWDERDHHSLMLAVICFTWHVAVNIILMLIVGSVIGCCYRRHTNVYSSVSSVPLKRLMNDDGEPEDDEEGEEMFSGKDVEIGNGKVKVYHDNDNEKIRSNGTVDDNSDVEFQAPVRK